MLKVRVRHGTELVFEDPAGTTRLVVTFMRTLRVPDDGSCYPLPAGMGPFPIRDVARYAGRVPPAWLARPGVMVPMYHREALWMSIESEHRHPNAIKVGAGYINAVSGKRWNRELSAPHRPSFFGKLLGETPAQDYIVCPPQHWFDGFHTGYGTVRQFVAVPLGEGKTVEGQLTGKEEHGGIQLLVYQPKPGRFPGQVLPPDPSAANERAGTPVLPKGSALPTAEDRVRLDQLATVPIPDPQVPPMMGVGPVQIQPSEMAGEQQTLRGWPSPKPPPMALPGAAPLGSLPPIAPAPLGPPPPIAPAPLAPPPGAAPMAPPGAAPLGPPQMAPVPMAPPPMAGSAPPLQGSVPSFQSMPPPGVSAPYGAPTMASARPPLPSVAMGASPAPVSTSVSQQVVPAAASVLGLAMGGQLMQKIYTDPYGIETWDESNYGEIFVHIVSAESFVRITGEQPPPTPISRASYDAAGFGWVAVYDDDLAEVDPGGDLRRVKPLSAFDKDR